jgi:hypothetical protein
MLARLRHDAIIGSHDQQAMIHPHRTRRHRMHKFLVTRHIDKPDYLSGLVRHIRKAKINRHAARFFFRQSISIHTGQSLDQRCFAMIDVARGADNHRVTTFNAQSLNLLLHLTCARPKPVLFLA